MGPLSVLPMLMVVQFIEKVMFTATNYSKIIGDRMLFNINVLNRNRHLPDRYKNRKLPLKIYRGFTDKDELEIKYGKNKTRRRFNSEYYFDLILKHFDYSQTLDKKQVFNFLREEMEHYLQLNQIVEIIEYIKNDTKVTLI